MELDKILKENSFIPEIGYLRKNIYINRETRGEIRVRLENSMIEIIFEIEGFDIVSLSRGHVNRISNSKDFNALVKKAIKNMYDQLSNDAYKYYLNNDD